MTRADFPVIGPGECSRYIATARLAPNAVALRIRQMLAPKMRVVCGWCNVSLGEIACDPVQHGEISHGICPACSAKYFGFTLQRDTPTSERSNVGWGNPGTDARCHAASISTAADSAAPTKETARTRAEVGGGDSLSSAIGAHGNDPHGTAYIRDANTESHEGGKSDEVTSRDTSARPALELLFDCAIEATIPLLRDRAGWWSGDENARATLRAFAVMLDAILCRDGNTNLRGGADGQVARVGEHADQHTTAAGPISK